MITMALAPAAETAAAASGINWLGWGGLGTSVLGTLWNGLQGKKTSDRNYDIQKQQLEYQKYLNNNQIQIQMADAQKAGINPIAMNGTQSLQSGNYSNAQPAQIDTSGILSMVENIVNTRTQKQIANEQAETQKEIARIQQQTAINVANINAETTKSEGKANREAQKTMADNKNALDELIAKNNLEQKEAESLRNITYNIDRFNAELQESYAASETQYQNYVDNMKRDLWNAYRETQYGIATSGMYSALTEYLMDKGEAAGNSVMYWIKDLFGLNNEEEGKKGTKRSRLDWEEYENWFKKNVEPNLKSKKPTKTEDIAQSSNSWSWN